MIMTTNFEQLELLAKEIEAFTPLYNLCTQAEQFVYVNQATSATFSRKALEHLIGIVFKLKKREAPDNLVDKINDPTFCEFAGVNPDFKSKAHFVRKIGNNGAHGTEVTLRECRNSVYNLYMVVMTVLQKLLNLTPNRWDPDKIPHMQLVIASTADATLTPEVAAGITAAIPAEAVSSTAPAQMPPAHEASEKETRELFIDMMLREAGWEVMEQKGLVVAGKACVEIAVEGMPTSESGRGYVDYVLFGQDGQPLAIIEAKRTGVSTEAGHEQAKIYADCLERKYGYRPAIYLSNGYHTQYLDGLGYPLRDVMSFHSHADLIYLREKRGRSMITDMEPNPDIAGRYYQLTAVKTICERFNAMRRRALIVMATGTGKTRTAISLCEVLTRNNWAKRILFLADRTSLVHQAYENFVTLLPNETKTVLNEEREPNMTARLVFSTYQTMIHYIDEEEKKFSVGQFDLIIIDEAHRSVFGEYGTIFDYFDSLLVGLTATPRDEIERSTYDLMGLEGGEPDFAYEHEDAVRDGYLVDHEDLVRHSNIMERGVKYSERSPEEQRMLEDIAFRSSQDAMLDPDAEDELDINEKDIFKRFYNRDTVSKMLEDLMENGLKVQGGEMIGKTIIFAPNHKTAEFIVKVFYEKYPEYSENNDFCRLIDNYVKHAQTLIDRFAVTQQLPQIAVSVDMLDTGIDIPACLNLVMFRPVHSKIKFDQMIGRGTRLCPNLMSDGSDKTKFLIFDWCNNFNYFSLNPRGASLTRVESLTERLFGLRLKIMYLLQQATYQEDEKTRAIYNELRQTLYGQVASLQDTRIAVRKVWKHIVPFRTESRWDYISEIDVAILDKEIKPLLPRTMAMDMALRFDVITYNVIVGKMSKDYESGIVAERCQSKIMQIAEQLQKRASIPQVQAKMEVIRQAMSNMFWEEAGVSDIERIRTELRDLIQFLQTNGRDDADLIVDFEDVVTASESDSTPEYNAQKTYRQKVLDYLAENMDSVAISKIYHLEQLTHADMMELERIFWTELGTKEDFERQTADHPVGSIAAFIRSIIQIDRQVALDKYRALIIGAQMTSDQEQYLKSILDYVCANGDIKADVFQTPQFQRMRWPQVFGNHLAKVFDFVRDLHQVIEIA